jgi:hypothetical protein
MTHEHLDTGTDQSGKPGPVKAHNDAIKVHPGAMEVNPGASVADPDPGSGIGCFLTPGSGMRDPGSGIGFFRIPDPKTIFLRAF